MPLGAETATTAPGALMRGGGALTSAEGGPASGAETKHVLHSKGNEQRSSVPSVLESSHLPLQAHPHLSPPSSRRLTCKGHTGAPLPSGLPQSHQQKSPAEDGREGGE